MNPDPAVEITCSQIGKRLAAFSAQRVEDGPQGRAAVAIILHEDSPGNTRVLIIERARRAGDPWSGDLAFPGGRLEPEDAGDQEAAERETREEIGVDLSAARLLGRLDDRAARVLPLTICAFVYAIDTVPALVLSDEVSSAYWISLADVIDSERQCQHRHYPAVDLLGSGHPPLWGVTYFFLYALLRDATDHPTGIQTMTAPPIDLGSRRELFVDSFLLDRLEGACQRLHPPERRGYVLEVQPPHENACTACYNLIDDGDGGLFLYYRGFYPIGVNYADHDLQQTCNVALSYDGVHFHRPRLELFPQEATGVAPNTIWQGYEAHNFCVFLDHNPQIDPQTRFKAVGGGAKNRLYGFQSADGIRWQRVQQEPLDVAGAFDSVNVPMWDPHAGCYRLFSRYFFEENGVRIRAIQSCTSDDFIHWTRPEPHRYATDVPLEQFYTNATVPCPGAEHILLSFPMRFLPDRTLDTEGMDYPGEGLSDAVFMSSRDGVNWDRTFQHAWLRPGREQRNWTHRNQTTAVGVIDTGDGEWSMYIAEHYGWNDNRLRRVTVRPWGFASLHCDVRGEALTKPLTFDGSQLQLNYATSAAGSVRVEIQDGDGTPIPGFTLDDAQPLFGDQIVTPARWADSSDVTCLQGRVIRLRIVLEDADLFCLRFV